MGCFSFFVDERVRLLFVLRVSLVLVLVTLVLVLVVLLVLVLAFLLVLVFVSICFQISKYFDFRKGRTSETKILRIFEINSSEKSLTSEVEPKKKN